MNYNRKMPFINPRCFELKIHRHFQVLHDGYMIEQIQYKNIINNFLKPTNELIFILKKQ